MNKGFYKGWYFKISYEKGALALIPGYTINEDGDIKGFIQVITPKFSFCKFYEEDISFEINPLCIKIGDNVFTKEFIDVDITNGNNSIKVNTYNTEYKRLKRSLFSPTIMGPLTYIRNLECYHSVLSINHKVNGSICINGENIDVRGARGYVESDCGYNFPKSWLYMQTNSFKGANASCMIAVADVNALFKEFKGIIGFIYTDGLRLDIGTYYGARLLDVETFEDGFTLKIRQSKYTIYISSKGDKKRKLLAPVNGVMSKEINEYIDGYTHVKVYKHDEKIFDEKASNSTIEFSGF